jgi:hypothetical protein
MITNEAFSQAYIVKITSEPYDSLTQYESLSNNGVDLQFTKTAFELPWDFLFFDEQYDLLNNNEFSYVSLNTESDHTFYPIYLFDNFWGRYNLVSNSDYRYGQTSPDNVCFEWRKVGSFTSPLDNYGTRGLATFKTCFWKNGDIDIHFGELIFDNTLFDTLFTYPGLAGYSPYIALTNPKDVDEAVILSTDPSNPFTLDKWDFFNTEKPPFIKKLPPTDLKIRFSLRRSSTENASFKPFKIPNPVTSEIVIPDDFQYDEFTIINNNATLVTSGKQTPSIDVQNLSQGVYFLLLKDGMVHYKYKFIKL